MQHTTPSFPMFLKRVCLGALALTLAVSLCPLPSAGKAFADPIAEKQAEAASVLANLNSMQATLDKLSVEYGEALMAQDEAEKSRDAAKERIDEIQVQIADLQERLGDRAREMYRNGSSTFLDMLLGSRSFEEFATGWDILNKVNANDASMVQERRELKEEAQVQADIYDQQAKVAKEKSEEAARATEVAEATIAEMKATYDGLSAEVAELVEEQRAAQEAADLARAQEQLNSGFGGGNQGGSTPSGNSGGGSPSGGNSGGGGGWTAPEPTYNPGSSNIVVNRAYDMIGKPYGWACTGPNSFDCSGLVGYCLTGGYGRVGTTYTYMAWPRTYDPQPGDICTNWDHCGIYIGGGQMIHAPQPGEYVKIGPVQGGMIYVRPPW